MFSNSLTGCYIEVSRGVLFFPFVSGRISEEGMREGKEEAEIVTWLPIERSLTQTARWPRKRPR